MTDGSTDIGQGEIIPLNARRASRHFAQITGSAPFPDELQAWLAERDWVLRLNALSGWQEIHTVDGIMPMTDALLAEIRFSLTYSSNGKEPAKEKLVDALMLIAERNRYHPVLGYLDGLQWDREPRVDTWICDYFGAEDTPLNRAVGRKILCAAVRRVQNPGCKFDHMLILQGAQGLGKSSAIKALCPDAAWFTDQLEVGADAKVTLEKTAGAWIIEMPELDGMGKKEAARVKSFLTTTSDRARLSYARYALDKPRQFVLFGTTNDDHYLTDTTGNRRFWIVRVTQADPAGIARVRDQLWAEAVHLAANEDLWLSEEGLAEAAAAVAKEATDTGEWSDLLTGAIPDRDLKVKAADVWTLVGINGYTEINKISKSHQAMMRTAMASLGFIKRKLRDEDGRPVAVWIRGDAKWVPWWKPEQQAGYSQPF